MKRRWYKSDPGLLAQLTSDLRSTYPDLHVYEEEGRIRVRGSFPVAHEGTIIDRYLIEIELLDDYPASAPIVREIGASIPRTADYHMNARGEACLFLPEERWKIYPDGTSLLVFLNGPVRHFFLGQGLVRRGEPWPFGQWGHGATGIREFYGELLGTDDLQVILSYLDCLAKKHIKGHWDCPCGSGKRLRHCHFRALQDLRAKIPRSVAKQSLTTLALPHHPRR